MANVNGILSLVRTVVFGVVSVFALIVLGIAAHLINLTNSYSAGVYYDFAALGVATAVLTLLTLPAMLLISFKRTGAISSYIAVELAWLTFLWIMWVATAGTTASVFWVNNCTGVSVCSEAQAVEAFSFLNWIFALVYSITLLVFAIISHNKGHSDVWTASVREFDFTAKGADHGAVPQSTLAPQFEQKVPVSQGQYPPQGVPSSYSPQPYVPQATPTAPQVQV